MDPRYQWMMYAAPMLAVVVFAVIYYQWQLRKGGVGGGGYPTSHVGGPEGAALKAAVARSDLSSLNATLHQTRQTGAWDDRMFFLDLISKELAKVHRMTVDAWVQNEPQSPNPYLVRGLHGIEWAWEARGTGTADSVSAGGRQLFQERLQMAEADFQAAAQLDPADPTPHLLLLDVARGLGHPSEVAAQHFQAAMQRDPDSFYACRNDLTLLHPKWSGSHRVAVETARQIAAAARPGSDLKSITLLAHLGLWEYATYFDKDPAAATAYLQRPEVRQELEAAFMQTLGARGYIPRRSSAVVRNSFACWLYLIRDKARLQQQIQLIGNGYTESPWWMIGSGGSYEQRAENGYREASTWAFGVF